MQSGRDFRARVLDLRHPALRPLWRRIVLVAVLAIWTGVELAFGNPVWAVLIGGIGVYAAYVFFFGFDRPTKEHRDQQP